MKSRTNRTSWEETSQTLTAPSKGSSRRIAVLAAHPDDETIGASVLLGRDRNPHVIFLTDGAPRDTKLWSPDFKGSGEEYAALRRSEAERALSYTNVRPQQVHWLGATDQEAIVSALDLANSLLQLLAEIEPDLLITHPYEGGHPDHDTAALLGHLVISHLERWTAPLLVEMTSYHMRNGRCVTGRFLDSNRGQEVCVCLSAAERARKQDMFNSYPSQRLVLNAFSLDQERFREAPRYDFSRSPHEGKLWYECMGWPMTGEQWRTSAAQIIADLPECACR